MIRALVVFACVALLAPCAQAGGSAEPDSGLGPPGTPVTEALQSLRDGAGMGSDVGGAVGGVIGGLRAWQEANEALSELDRELDRSLADDGDGPQVPSSCAEDPDCNACFARAYERVNFARMVLARLKSIHTRVHAYIEAQKSFGDTVSPVHGISGLAWQYARRDIEQAKNDFDKTSQHKYDQLIGTMRSALDDVAACERDHFDNPDWNSRYGFMYLETVKAAYSLD